MKRELTTLQIFNQVDTYWTIERCQGKRKFSWTLMKLPEALTWKPIWKKRENVHFSSSLWWRIFHSFDTHRELCRQEPQISKSTKEKFGNRKLSKALLLPANSLKSTDQRSLQGSSLQETAGNVDSKARKREKK